MTNKKPLTKTQKDHKANQSNPNPKTPGVNKANAAVERNRQEQLKKKK